MALKINEAVKKLNVLKDVFSLRNLTVSLVSALLVIGLCYLSSIVGTAIQLKLLANPNMYTIYLLLTIILFFVAVLGPALLAAIYTKDWASFVYIILLEIMWLSIFMAVLYFTTPDKTFDPSEMMLQ